MPSILPLNEFFGQKRDFCNSVISVLFLYFREISQPQQEKKKTSKKSHYDKRVLNDIVWMCYK